MRRIAYGTAVIKTRAPGAKPSRCAAFPPFTARLTSPALSGKATSSPGSTAPNISR